MVDLAHGLQVRWIEEQSLVAAMRTDVVNHCAVRCRVLTDAEHVGVLAGVVIPQQDLMPQLLPSLGLVPLAPRDVMVPLLKAGLLVARRSAYARSKRPYPWLQCLEASHIS